MIRWVGMLAMAAALDARDAGGADAGARPDAGVALSDAGVDAGPPIDVVKPKPRWSWQRAPDGGYFSSDGVTDRLEMRVGETAELRLDLPIILMQCDTTLVTLNATTDTLLLTAFAPGKTKCGFWYRQNAFPHRYLELTVNPG